jgi:hypothetical protein
VINTNKNTIKVFNQLLGPFKLLPEIPLLEEVIIQMPNMATQA